MAKPRAKKGAKTARVRVRRGPASAAPPGLEEYRLLTYQERSAITGEPLGTLYARVARGTVDHVRLGKKTVRFRLQDVLREIDAGLRPAKGSRPADVLRDAQGFSARCH